MRTTLNIDDDVLRAAKLLAATEGVDVGVVLSNLARRGLEKVPHRVRKGVKLLPAPLSTGLATMGQANALDD